MKFFVFYFHWKRYKQRAMFDRKWECSNMRKSLPVIAVSWSKLRCFRGWQAAYLEMFTNPFLCQLLSFACRSLKIEFLWQTWRKRGEQLGMRLSNSGRVWRWNRKMKKLARQDRKVSKAGFPLRISWRARTTAIPGRARTKGWSFMKTCLSLSLKTQ